MSSPQKSPETFTNVYINNLDPTVDENTLRYLCETHGGKVISLVIIRNEDQASMGYGFCNFSTHEEALRAIREMNNIFVGSKKISVSRAASKNERIQFLNSVHQQNLEYSPHENPNVYIKNLDYNIEEEDLRKLFDRFGPIINVRVMRDAVGNSRGFGFVSFRSHKDAQRAVDEMNGMKIGRFTVRTDFYEPKKSRQEKLEKLHGSVRVPSPTSSSSSSYSTSPTTVTTGIAYPTSPSTSTFSTSPSAAITYAATTATTTTAASSSSASAYSTSPTLTLPLRPPVHSPNLSLPLRPAGTSSGATSPSISLPLKPALTSPAMSPTLTLHQRPLATSPATSPTFTLQPRPLATSPTALSLHPAPLNIRATSPQRLQPLTSQQQHQQLPQYQSKQQWQLDFGKNELSLMPDDILESINTTTATIPQVPIGGPLTAGTTTAAATGTSLMESSEHVVDDDDPADFLGIGNDGPTPTAVSPSLFGGQPSLLLPQLPGEPVTGAMPVSSLFCDPYSVTASAPTTRGIEHYRSLTPSRSPVAWNLRPPAAAIAALQGEDSAARYGAIGEDFETEAAAEEEEGAEEAERWRYSIFVYGLKYVTDPREVCKLFFDFKNVMAKPLLSGRMLPTGVWKVAFDSEANAQRALRIARTLYVRNRRIEAERCPVPKAVNVPVKNMHSYSVSPEARGILSFKTGGH